MPGAGDAPLPSNPLAEYQKRLAARQAEQARLERRHRRLGSANLAVLGALVAVAGVALAWHAISLFWTLIPAAAFVALASLHARALRALRNCTRVAAFYRRGLSRLSGDWMGKGDKGQRFLDPAHPYARDLDVFGPGSLFELLSAARTPGGDQALAGWLLEAASPGEIGARQAAVDDLRPRLDLREELAVLGEDVGRAVSPEALAAWGEAAPVLRPGPVRAVLVLLALGWVASLVAWGAWGRWDFAVIVSALNLSVSSRFRKRMLGIAPAAGIRAAADESGADSHATYRAARDVERVAPELELLAAVLARLDREPFSCPKLGDLKAALRAEGLAPAQALARLSRLVEYLEQRRHLAVKAVDAFIFWRLQWAFAVEAWRARFGGALRGWLAAVGEIEALSSLAGYAYEHPADVFPEFSAESPLFEAEGLAHPLLPEGRAVPNDLRLGRDLRLIVISGPNMAGKSTLVRAVGVNAVLAQCGAPVRARRLRLSPLAVAASICVLDSLQGGVSRFYAEITRLKLITGMTEDARPVLFLLDELLNGTNSHDRRVGAEAVVRSLVSRGAIGLVTTHDLALARLAGDPALGAANFHFADHLEDGELRFDYRMSPGVVETTNALKLMRSIGLDV